MSILTEKQRKQNLFDATWKTAQEMDHRSAIVSAEGVQCLYLAPDGNKCFIGARLRPERYVPAMDDPAAGSSVASIFGRYPEVKQDFIEDGYTVDTEFLSQLQSIHDNDFPFRMESLKRVADEYSLKYPA